MNIKTGKLGCDYGATITRLKAGMYHVSLDHIDPAQDYQGKWKILTKPPKYWALIERSDRGRNWCFGIYSSAHSLDVVIDDDLSARPIRIGYSPGLAHCGFMVQCYLREVEGICPVNLRFIDG